MESSAELAQALGQLRSLRGLALCLLAKQGQISFKQNNGLLVIAFKVARFAKNAIGITNLDEAFPELFLILAVTFNFSAQSHQEFTGQKQPFLLLAKAKVRGRKGFQNINQPAIISRIKVCHFAKNRQSFLKCHQGLPGLTQRGMSNTELIQGQCQWLSQGRIALHP
ncbi:MAG: hypothetical protein VKO26_09315 [Cyanobacteriota bacterium]|nr:hypothetical protein [Cyanobacteriota bacterium]